MATTKQFTRDDLLNLKPAHDSFVGIDSDGCVFDTMEIKQKKCFHGLIVSHWKLEKIEKAVRQTAEFVNLYSKWRGQNRFIALVKMWDLLLTHPDVKKAGVTIPAFSDMRNYVKTGKALGNPELECVVKETGNAELASLLKWSKDVNAMVARTVKNIPPFKWVKESLAKIRQNSDAICVSQTPTEALVREWKEHRIGPYVAVIAGQELGTKTEHIALATGGRYRSDRILMIGDALGDKKAARENQAHFYPINPAHEAESWERFYTEAYDRFLNGTYRGAYEDKLVAEFEALLPEKAPWQK